MKGHLCTILHAHLPFIKHPEVDPFLEESWLYEAIAESYVPLLSACDRLLRDGIDFRLAFTISPPLCEMLADDLLKDRYARWVQSRIELCKDEGKRRRGTEFEAVARMYLALFIEAQRYLEGGSLTRAFRRLYESGRVELLTCAATHGFLPLMLNERAANAQVAVAVANFRKHFGKAPAGIWLPECAYAPGLDDLLARHGVRYFVLEAHGLLNADVVPRYGLWAPARLPSGVYVLGRDLETSKQVWSAREGYPGDPVYREFYRDLGFDANYETIRPYLLPDGVRRNVGLKYHRVTGSVPLDAKKPYDPATAQRRAAEHAKDFCSKRRRQVRAIAEGLGIEPVIVAPYDAELFGHWWFEGPMFLEEVMRRLGPEVRPILPFEAVDRWPKAQPIKPSASSWGDKGYYEVWLNGANDWMYRHLHRAQDVMVRLARMGKDAPGMKRRALNQAGRELLLAQSSDWAFLMTVGTAVPYAHRRFKEHIRDFFALASQIESGLIDEPRLQWLEKKNSIFQELDFTVWA